MPWFVQDQGDPFSWACRLHITPSSTAALIANISNSSHHLWIAFPVIDAARKRLFHLQRLN